jgi:hypothetical protein
MKPALPLVFLAAFSLGCAEATIDGVWQFSMQATDYLGDTCTESVSHNFTDAWVPSDETDEESPWTEADTESHSDKVFYGLITSTGPDAATLIIGTEAYPGVHEADGAWSFTWTSMSSGSDDASHASGYVWSASSDQTREVIFELQLSGDVLIGTEATYTSSTQTWSESDSWSVKELIGYLPGDASTGQIPSHNYLETDDGDPFSEATIPAYNGAEDLDCDDTSCILNRMVTCEESWPIDAVRTTLSTGEDYEGVVGAGQDEGY